MLLFLVGRRTCKEETRQVGQEGDRGSQQGGESSVETSERKREKVEEETEERGSCKGG